MVTLSCGRPYVLVACNGGISLGDVRVKSCCKTSARSQNTSFREQLTKSLTSLFSCSIHFVHCVVCILGYFRTVLNSFTVHNSLRSKSHEHTDLFGLPLYRPSNWLCFLSHFLVDHNLGQPPSWLRILSHILV
ncbi:hypothetical protein RRG08_025378 [Elysia crispata]|uniref:Uncharacterized protein n=1 Tax=Elysia crispata TaxID=231223 RepID=A0AAE1B500_9GAST|nr:hypothetical protein RRG08_025378 [Elysia crispata]